MTATFGDDRLPARFWRKVQVVTSGCWEWTASKNQTGYGLFGIRSGRMRASHRVAYEALVGPVPDGKELDHLCRVRGCANPVHLEPVDHRTNVRRGVAPTAVNANKTHCIRGHEFTGANLVIRPNGTRRCRACNNATRDERRRK